MQKIAQMITLGIMFRTLGALKYTPSERHRISCVNLYASHGVTHYAFHINLCALPRQSRIPLVFTTPPSHPELSAMPLRAVAAILLNGTKSVLFFHAC